MGRRSLELFGSLAVSCHDLFCGGVPVHTENFVEGALHDGPMGSKHNALRCDRAQRLHALSIETARALNMHTRGKPLPIWSILSLRRAPQFRPAQRTLIQAGPCKTPI